MHPTLMEAFEAVLGTACFAMFLLPSGYLAASLTNLNHFRQRSRPEQLLWSIALSLPLTIVLAELLGRALTATTVIAVFAAIALAAAFVFVKTPYITTASNDKRPVAIATAAALLLAAYLILTLIDVQVGHRLFVSTTITDWGVRIPLVESAIRSRVPPLNPLSALGPVGPLGHAIPSLRYYYFWYVLCALPARLLHTPPDAALIASAVWAGFNLLAVTFLAFKYLAGNLAGGLVNTTASTRRHALQLFLPMLVIGLDILPTIGTYLGHASHPYLDIEWWSPDHTPGLLTALVYAPHHIAGLLCCIVAYLILIPDPDLPQPASSPDFNSSLLRALLAGAAFAACVGTSTFIAFIFVLASLFWTITLLRTRNVTQLATLAASGIFAYLFSRPFLHELKSNSSAAHGFASFAWRSSPHLQDEFLRRGILLTHPIAAFLAQQPFILALDFAELGFFAFVAAHQIRTQLIPALRNKLTLTQGQRALWSIFLGAALAWLFLSSAVTSSGNDLGGHAGLILRFILVLWSPAYLQHLRTQRHTQHRKLIPVLALACLFLGLAGSLLDAILHRVYVPLFDAHLLKRPAGLFFEPDHLSARFYDIHAVWQQLDHLLPANARVQSDPVGPLEMAVTRYSNRQLIASDAGCGTAFGGDLEACAPVRAQLRHLFADDTTDTNIDGLAIPARPKTLITTADFTQTCRDLSLTAILVNATDPVWNQTQSWVWTLTPIATQPTARAYLCPT